MKRLILWLIIVLVAIAATAAAEETKKTSKEDPVNVGYDKGFFIKNNDDSFIFKINGRFQPQVYFTKVTGSDSNWTFGIRRARLDFNATMVSDNIMNISLEHATKSASFDYVNVTNAYAIHKFMPELSVTAGMVGLPLDIIGWRSSNGYQLPEAPITNSQTDGSAAQMTPLRTSFGVPNGLGMTLDGTFSKKLYYRVSVINGAAEATHTVSATGVVTKAAGGQESNYELNFNKRVSAGARLAYDIFENAGSFENDIPYSEKARWTISIGGTYQSKREDPNFVVMPTIGYLITGSAGTSFKYRGFSITAEAYGRKTKIDNPGSATFYSNTLDDMAYYVDSGYFVIPNKLEIAGRIAQIFREGPHNNSYEIDGGINWFPTGKPNLKLMTAYTMQRYYEKQSEGSAARTQFFKVFLATFF